MVTIGLVYPITFSAPPATISSSIFSIFISGENRELQRKRKVTKWFKTFCDWNWGPPWETFQKRICFILIDPFAVLLTTVTVVVNTLFLAIEHHGMENNPILMNTLLIGNGV